MQKNITLYLLCLFGLIGYPQENKINEVNNYFTFSQLLENIHLHLNKTSFTKGEHLWFKAYIQNQITQLPSTVTTNLNLGIYSASGKEISRKLVRVVNGIASGDFIIDSSFEEGTFFVLAWTNYMLNLKKFEPFQQQIKILGEYSGNENQDISEVEIKSYPEGGALISGAFNYIGIHLKNLDRFDNTSPEIKLVDSFGNAIVSNITTNDEGFGKIGFMVEKDKTYSFHLKKQNGNYLKIPLPKASHANIGLSIDIMGKKHILAKLVSSKDVLSRKQGAMYTLAIVKDTNISIQNWQINEAQLAISIDRDSIPYGVNKAILFDESLRPIAWRMFFNHVEKKKRVAEVNLVHKLNTTRDSLELSFSTKSSEPYEINLSVSILPGITKAYNPQNSLVSSFLIKPYIQGLYSYNYDFANFDRFQNYALDTQLMVEGWGKYNWDDMVEPEGETNYIVENGIPITGKVPDADLRNENHILLMTEESKSLIFEELKNDKSFSSQMILYVNDSLGISLIGKKGVLRKPKLEIEIDSSWKKNKIDVMKYLSSVKPDIYFSQTNDGDEILSINGEGGVITLDEVVVQSNVWRDNSLKLNSAEIDGRSIGDFEIQKYGTIGRYLPKLGFIIGSEAGKLVVRSRGIGNPIIPVTIADMGPGDGMALNMSLSRVQTILHDMDRKGWIVIVLRDNQYVSPENRNKFIKQFIRNGYAKPTEFFNPRYEDYDSLAFKRYGALYWKSNILVTNEETNSIKFPIKSQKQLKVFIEGISGEGKLISLEKSIEELN